MKKIVALVLSLVMVLGLATTAFAATTSTGTVSTTSVTPEKAGWYVVAGKLGADSLTDTGVTVAKIEKTTVTGKVTNDVAYYVPTIYCINGTSAYYAEVAKADATFALKNNGAYIFLAPIGNYADANKAVDGAATKIVMDAFVLPADDEVDCGEAFVTVATDTDVPVPYYVSGKTFYATEGNVMAYYNGEFVLVGAQNFGFKLHSWDADSVIVKDTDVKGVKVPVSVECEDCEETFSVVYKTAFDNAWVKNVNYDNYPWDGDYYVLLNPVTVVTPATPVVDGEKVESAETFDAGIAMYVGMSVMAAAGSAVVLKKKD